MAEPTHWSDWAQQPDVRIACTQSYGRPWTTTALPEGVYSVDSTLYSFDVTAVTCEACKALPAFQAARGTLTEYVMHELRYGVTVRYRQATGHVLKGHVHSIRDDKVWVQDPVYCAIEPISRDQIFEVNPPDPAPEP